MITVQNQEIPLFISCSNINTQGNKTGTWRFVRPVYNEKTAPCSKACPAGEDIAEIEMLALRGMFKEAWETIIMENPFPAVCGRVCFHFCEKACNRSEFDEAVAIHNIERFLGDLAIAEKYGIQNTEFRIQKKIAIIGAGPAGLSAGYFLNRLGYLCDIFEAGKEPGGLLRWGIPSYRLPDNILKQEIDRIVRLGVNIFCEKHINQDFINNAKGKYDAVFIACGYGRSLKMNIDGEEMTSDGLEFLYNARKMDSHFHGNDKAGFQGNIAVIGGGNTAIDVARSLIRLGASPIIVYRRRKQDMPAFEHEIEMALKEGVLIKELLAPIKIENKNENYLITLQKMKLADISNDGRMSVIPDENKTEILEVSKIFTAIGAEVKENWQNPPEKNQDILKLSHCNFVKSDLPMIFGGDLTNSTKSVTDAIASGKQTAIALDIFFKSGFESIEKELEKCRVGSGNALSMEIYLNGKRKNRNPHTITFKEINTDYFNNLSRLSPDSLSPVQSIKTFLEIEQTFSEQSVISEAKRCFNCGICNDCDNCRLFCPEMSVFLSNQRSINLDYCKGCGICVVECPRNAMSLEEEKYERSN